MSKSKPAAAAAPETTQAKPTAPAAICPDTGRQLDEWGVPVSGPARIAWLAKIGKPDPRDEPEAWASPAPTDPDTTTPADAAGQEQ